MGRIKKAPVRTAEPKSSASNFCGTCYKMVESNTFATEETQEIITSAYNYLYSSCESHVFAYIGKELKFCEYCFDSVLLLMKYNEQLKSLEYAKFNMETAIADLRNKFSLAVLNRREMFNSNIINNEKSDSVQSNAVLKITHDPCNVLPHGNNSVGKMIDGNEGAFSTIVNEDEIPEGLVLSSAVKEVENCVNLDINDLDENNEQEVSTPQDGEALELEEMVSMTVERNEDGEQDEMIGEHTSKEHRGLKSFQLKGILKKQRNSAGINIVKKSVQFIEPVGVNTANTGRKRNDGEHVKVVNEPTTKKQHGLQSIEMEESPSQKNKTLRKQKKSVNVNQVRSAERKNKDSVFVGIKERRLSDVPLVALKKDKMKTLNPKYFYKCWRCGIMFNRVLLIKRHHEQSHSGRANRVRKDNFLQFTNNKKKIRLISWKT